MLPLCGGEGHITTSLSVCPALAIIATDEEMPADYLENEAI